MKRIHSRLLLAAALVATLVAAWFAPDEAPPQSSDASTPAPRNHAERTSTPPHALAAPAPSRVALPLPENRTPAFRAAFSKLTNGSANLFAQRQWYVPPPPPPPPLPAIPSKPTAPPLPIKWLGRLADNDDSKTFLNWNGRLYIAKVGDVLQQTYRLDEVENGRLVFTYLPLNEQQILYTGK